VVVLRADQLLVLLFRLDSLRENCYYKEKHLTAVSDKKKPKEKEAGPLASLFILVLCR
jgi:hypothetical protein